MDGSSMNEVVQPSGFFRLSPLQRRCTALIHRPFLGIQHVRFRQLKPPLLGELQKVLKLKR
jgi:hypothetical protein